MKELKPIQLYEEYNNLPVITAREKLPRNMFQTKEEISKWIDSWKDEYLNEHNKGATRLGHGIYTINDDLTVDVKGAFEVNLSDMDLEYLPVQFGTITDSPFNINNNPKLQSLKGVPLRLKDGGFSCFGCKSLVIMEYFPIEVQWSVNYMRCDSLVSDKLPKGIGRGNKGPYKSDLIGTLEERAIRFCEWLPNSPDIIKSIDWVKLNDPKLFKVIETILPEYALRYNITEITDGYSDDVKDIASTALKGNHKLR